MAFFCSLLVAALPFLPPQILLLFTVILCIFSFRLSPSSFFKKNIFSFYLLGILSLFGYGLFIGLVNAYPFDHIIRNTSGILGVLSFYFFSNRFLSFSFLLKSLIGVGIFYTILLLFLYFLILTQNYSLLSVAYDLLGASGGTTDHIRFYSPTLFLSCLFLFPMLFSTRLTLAEIFDLDHVTAFYLFILKFCAAIIFMVLCLTMGSKASYLSILFIAVNYLIASSRLLDSSSLLMVSTKIPIIFLFLGAILFLLFSYDFLVNYYNPFSADLSGNSERLFQLSSIQDYLSLWGNGSGAPLPSSLIRDISAPYGTEISLLAAIHNYGVFSILLFVTALFSVFASVIPFFLFSRSLRVRYKSQIVIVTSLLLSCSLYFIASLGNPVLYHPLLWFVLGAAIGLYSHLQSRPL
jgi:hypothetical protein